MNYDKSRSLQKRAHALIPGGAHTYAKGDDQYPEEAPGFILRGDGSHVWDVDGNEFIEYGMGLRSVTLGHAYRPVIDAAYQEMLRGSNFTRPHPLEVHLAEEFLSVITGAEMVKFSKNGSDVTSAAVRLSRAYTGRDFVAICAQPFFSVDDWFIGATPMNAGVPKAVQRLTLTFQYNSIESLQALFRQYPGQIACVILEAEKDVPPLNGFLHEVQHLCKQQGTVFILDEMITGFRWHIGGAQQYYGLTPDLSAFGKALGNGFSVAALAGKADILHLGGLHHDKERVFLLSYTHGAETCSLAAAREVIRTYKREPVIEVMWERGRLLKEGVQKAIETHRLQDHFKLLGPPCCMVYATFDPKRQPSQPFRTLFLQEMIRRGILAPSFIVSYAHTELDISRTVEAAQDSLGIYRHAIDEGIEKYLVGRSVKPVWRTFN
ncbi:MAG: glutamate-1-semialdehyde 2,1-aminomutase [Nitrospirota bacterium]